MNLTGIITGGGKGIGLETCINLLKNNYKIISISRSHNKSINNLKKKYSKKFFFYKYDLSKTAGIEKLLKKIFINHKNISFLVNNAGIRSRLKFDKSNEKIINKVLRNNFVAPFILSKNFLKFSKEKNKSIIMITSIVGNLGFDELSNYASSKGALEALTKSLAIEYAKKGVRINSIAPGFVESSYATNFKKNNKLYKWTLNKIPMGRWGKCSEISPMVEFLISNKSSYITGSTIFIDGGWSA